jgi:hypothetical protein
MYYKIIYILGVFYRRYTQTFWIVLNFCKGQVDIRKYRLVEGLLWMKDLKKKHVVYGFSSGEWPRCSLSP